VEKLFFLVCVDLSDYVGWMSGVDVFDMELDLMIKIKKWVIVVASLEYFFSDVMLYVVGVFVVLVEVQELFVLVDGLDFECIVCVGFA